MIFSSFEFLFVFLPVNLAIFYFCSARNYTLSAKSSLIAGSLVFYAWSGLRFLPLVVASVCVNYAVGGCMRRLPEWSQSLFRAGIVFNLGLLGFFKYATFVSANLAALFGSSFFAEAIVLPLAISFFTFQQIAYLTEIHRGEPAAASFVDYALFILFFPHLVAGPITHHTEMLPQFARAGRAGGRSDMALMGIAILIGGLAKKTLLADTLATIAVPVFATAAGSPLSAADAWSGALAYTFQLYFDFSGYSDMAIGIGLLFGIRFPVNFAQPYQAASIIEFWRRWHITLSRFLRNYLYIPLGGSRHGGPRRLVNLMLTMVLGGLWHGAGWTFVIWGALHGGLLVVNHAWRGWFGQARGPVARLAAWALTFTAVVAGWVVFRAASMDAAIHMLAAMAGRDGFTPVPGLPDPVLVVALLALAGGVALLMPSVLDLAGYSPDPGHHPTAGRSWRPRLTAAAMGLVAGLCVARLPNPGVFLYFSF